MNKTVPVLIISLVISFILVWRLANRSPIETRRPENILVIGTNAEYAPFSFVQGKTITGFDIDLIEEVAKRLNKTVQLQDMPFDGLISALQLGSIQVIAAGITPTPERAERILFTKPYLTGDQLLIISPAGAPIKNLDQLKGKKVAVNEGFTADYYMSKIQGPELIKFATAIESFMTLESGRVDALVAAKNTVKPFLEHYGAEKFFIVSIPDTTDEYALAISKKYPELLEPIQKAIDEITADGTLEKLKKKWGLE
jgi:polar amino acid transport system substrate-binding protein